VSGPAVPGRRITLGPGGMRILDAIAAASGSDTPTQDSQTALQGLTDAQTQTLLNVRATRGSEAAAAVRATAVLAESSAAIKSPVREVMVRLSRDGVTATVPLATLVADPGENIYVQPGDVLTLDTHPRTFSVFGATGRNAAITFTRDKLSLSEALAQSGGLNDNVADPRAVFLFRYEPRSIVEALGQPIATRAPSGVSPIAYRLDLRDPKAYFLAKEFPVHDKDIIFVAEAESQPVYRFFSALSNITGPIETGLLVCQNGNC
jgi:polysaccharide export outer membrane protein